MRLQENQLIADLLGTTGVFAVIGGPEYQPLFRGVPNTLYVKAKGTNLAPWIPHQH
jgi:hypothetical protein